ncbi:DUF4123 domain-containing protein [Pseudomonas mosselii]|uniref:DUF4123 domain-containing protein n=1 Tax=Pseudomonas mosselii TaxID=78327 RepID=UPI00260F47C8|nr:DUF4123 domain-containing protein [Pseudomonas mosselii]MDN4500766.1 DUF4123 domain-containing protein [Pseudomonas mosselii]
MKPEYLLDLVAQARKPDDFLYLLLDPLANCGPEHALSIAALTRQLGVEAVECVMRDDLAHLTAECPTLVELAAPGHPADTLLQLTAVHALSEVDFDRRHVCGWLLSEQPLPVIARHLAARCLTMPPVAGPATAPWFEPLRLELLHATMLDISDVLWPLSACLYPTACGTFACVQGRAFARDLVIPHAVRELQYMAPQVRCLLGAWRLLNQSPPSYSPLAWKGPSSLPPKAPFHVYQLIVAAWARGLVDLDDASCLVLHQIMIHPRLLEHPTIQHDFNQAVAGECRLVSRFATYSDYDWSKVVAALPQSRSYP